MSEFNNFNRSYYRVGSTGHDNYYRLLERIQWVKVAVIYGFPKKYSPKISLPSINLTHCNLAIQHTKLFTQSIIQHMNRNGAYYQRQKWTRVLELALAERSFDLRTSGLWAQHASAAPLCYITIARLFAQLYLSQLSLTPRIINVYLALFLLDENKIFPSSTTRLLGVS